MANMCQIWWIFYLEIPNSTRKLESLFLLCVTIVIPWIKWKCYLKISLLNSEFLNKKSAKFDKNSSFLYKLRKIIFLIFFWNSNRDFKTVIETVIVSFYIYLVWRSFVCLFVCKFQQQCSIESTMISWGTRAELNASNEISVKYFLLFQLHSFITTAA